MPFELKTESLSLRNSPRFQGAKAEIISSILEASAKLRAIKSSPSSPEVKAHYMKLLQEFTQDRGRDLYFPFLGSGFGAGPFVELMDGSVKYDMITGIGIQFFGHVHPQLLEVLVDSLPTNVMQGNLEPGIEMKELLRAILSKVGAGSKLKHGWILCSGTMANEVALKIIRQKKDPATKIFAFKDCFAGRSTTMQEVTDNPGYRQGQPVYGEVHYLPFYDAKQGLEASIEATRRTLQEGLKRYPGKFATLMIELVQGEGGFHSAPRDYYVRVFEEAKKGGLAIWVDEIQTFGRTGELFAYQKFELSEWVDVVTIGKMLLACMVLYSEEYNPKPGLIAGTFSGSTVALKAAKKVVEILCQEGFLGEEGKIQQLSARFADRLKQLSVGECKGLIQEIRAIGGMIAFVPLGGTMEEAKAVLMRLFDLGVVAFYCGHGPILIRLLPPLGAMSEGDVDEVCSLIGKALLEVAKKK